MLGYLLRCTYNSRAVKLNFYCMNLCRYLSSLRWHPSNTNLSFLYWEIVFFYFWFILAMMCLYNSTIRMRLLLSGSDDTFRRLQQLLQYRVRQKYTSHSVSQRDEFFPGFRRSFQGLSKDKTWQPSTTSVVGSAKRDWSCFPWAAFLSRGPARLTTASVSALVTLNSWVAAQPISILARCHSWTTWSVVEAHSGHIWTSSSTILRWVSITVITRGEIVQKNENSEALHSSLILFGITFEAGTRSERNLCLLGSKFGFRQMFFKDFKMLHKIVFSSIWRAVSTFFCLCCF